MTDRASRWDLQAKRGDPLRPAHFLPSVHMARITGKNGVAGFGSRGLRTPAEDMSPSGLKTSSLHPYTLYLTP